MRARLLPILCILAGALLLTSGAAARCIKRHHVQVATGTGPSGWGWTVDASIGDNGSCDDWLFGVEFELQGATSWGTSTGIPAGGHPGRGYTMDAADNLLEDGSYRVFSGVANAEAAKILATLSDGKRLTIRPKSPPRSLIRKNSWLRGVRYFVDYYRPEGLVTQVAVFDASGVLLHREKHFESF